MEINDRVYQATAAKSLVEILKYFLVLGGSHVSCFVVESNNEWSDSSELVSDSASFVCGVSTSRLSFCIFFFLNFPD